jgi:hypothetical protein
MGIFAGIEIANKYYKEKLFLIFLKMNKFNELAIENLRLEI